MASASGFGWRDRWAVTRRVWSRMGESNLSLIAAGVAFYAMLALFPTIGALTSIYGLLSDPSDLPAILDQLRAVAPPAAVDLIEAQLQGIVTADVGGLQLATFVGLLVAIWSSKAGVMAMMQGLTIAYGEDAGRGFFSSQFRSYVLTFVLLLMAAVAVAVLVVTPAVLAILGLSGGVVVYLLRWILAIGVVMISIGVLYRYGPSRKHGRTGWLSWGSILATGLWLAASGAFSFYVANFSSYNETYGSLGAVIALLIWFFLTAFVVLLGGSVNAEATVQEEKVEAAARAAVATQSPAQASRP